MDRVRVDAGMLPLETDILRSERNTMVSIAQLSEAVLGTSPCVNGFSCLPTVPPSLSVNLSAGQVYQQAQLEASTWSSLSVDTHTVVKQGILLDPTTLTLTPPATVGTSVYVLVQVQYADSDVDPVIRPFYNPANPQQPYNGPNNSNASTPTTRKGGVVVSLKYGVASTSPSQPIQDAGFTGLFVIGLGYGQTQITSGNITPYFGAPGVIAKLPTIPQSLQQGAWNTVLDSSATPNLITGAPNPPLTAYANGTRLSVYVGNTNTGSVTIRMPNLPDRNLVRQNGTTLQAGDIVRNTWVDVQDDGIQWRIVGLARGEAARFTSIQTLYVRTDGSDVTGDGSANTAATAFQTINGALAQIAKYVQIGTGYTVQLGIPGTYAAPGQIVGLNVTIQGDPANQALYILQGAGQGGQPPVTAFRASVNLVGVTMYNTGTGVDTVSASTFGQLSLTNVTFTAVAGSPYSHIACYENGAITINGGNVIAASMGGWLRVLGGTVAIAQTTITFTGSPTWSGYGVFVTDIGRVRPAGSPVLSGSASGTRYYIDQNSVLNSSGGGANYFPGSVAGVNGGSGAQYI